MTIKGKHLRMVRLDEEGNPVGSAFDADGQLELRIERGEADEVIRFPETTASVEIALREMSLGMYVLLTGQTWLLSETYTAMGAEYQFDYTGLLTPYEERLGNCYELAALAFTDYHFERDGVDKVDAMEYHDVPVPTTLVHGWYSSPSTRDNPIQHAWVVLSDDRIWEPISSLIYNTEKFYTFCEPHDLVTYAEAEVVPNMLRYGHYGRWHDDA